MDDLTQGIRVFKALSDPTRLLILRQLAKGEDCANRIQKALNLTQSGLSYHMKLLVDSGLIESRCEGKLTYYTLSEKGREEAVRLLRHLTGAEADS